MEYQFIIKIVLLGRVFTTTITSDRFDDGFEEAGEIVLSIHNKYHVDAMVEIKQVEKVLPMAA